MLVSHLLKNGRSIEDKGPDKRKAPKENGEDSQNYSCDGHAADLVRRPNWWYRFRYPVFVVHKQPPSNNRRRKKQVLSHDSILHQPREKERIQA